MPYRTKQEETTFVFKSDFKSEITTFNYEVSMTHKEPKDFFALIETLNEQKYSMNVSYPIVMKKTPKGLLSKFTLQFHQNH